MVLTRRRLGSILSRQVYRVRTRLLERPDPFGKGKRLGTRAASEGILVPLVGSTGGSGLTFSYRDWHQGCAFQSKYRMDRCVHSCAQAPQKT